MMQNFSGRSMKVKLRIIVLTICAMVLLITSLVGIASKLASFRTTMIENLTMLAHVVGSNSRAALMFNAFEDATLVLSSLQAEPHIFQAFLYNADGTLFSQYKRVMMPDFTISGQATSLGTSKTVAQFHLHYLELSVPVILDEESIGSIHLYSDLKTLYADLFEQLLITLLAVFGALGVAYFISSKMERLIVDPIVRLAKVMKQVPKHQNYRFRVDKVSEDELGTLIDGFNGVLEEIQVRDEHIEKHRIHLEQRVSEQTEQLSKDNKAITQVIQTVTEAKEFAEVANESKSRLLAGMSHELCTSMKRVLNLTEGLSDTNMDEKQQQSTNAIHRSVTSLLSMTHNMLDYSTIESGQLALDDSVLNLQAVIKEVTGLLTESASQKGLTLSYEIQPDIDTAYRGDSGRLQQIVFNLVDNAIKVADSGSIQILVNESEIQGETALIQFEICHTDIAIATETQVCLFDSFVQVKGSVSQEYSDTGLGLIISKQLINLMGGDINIKGEAGEGSLFRFTVRLHIEAVASDQNVDSMNQLWGMRILVVDGNATSREIILHQLVDWQATCLGVAQCLEALQLLQMAARQQRPFQVVLLDLHMLDMDAMTLAKRIVEDPQMSDLRLIMLGSSIDTGNAVEQQKAGIETYLSKPVQPADLYRCLNYKPEKPAAPIEILNPPDQWSGSGVRVLLAESNSINQAVAVGMLEQMRCQVTIVKSTQEALDTLSKGKYDLVLMDLQMPDRGGLKATEEIRHREQGSIIHIPVIALTVNTLQEMTETCLLAGMDDYLDKPFTLAQLRRILMKYVPEPQPVSAIVDDIKANAETGTQAKLLGKQNPVTGINTRKQVLDLGALDNIRSLQQPGKPDVLQKVIELYLCSATELMLEMHTAIENGDVEVLQRAAHTLKSSSANLGAKDLADKCQGVEIRARDNRLGDIGSLINNIVNDFDEVNRELKALLKDKAA